MEPNELPSLTVVIPTHNRRHSLRRTLESLGHAYPKEADKLEVVVVDDGSTDGTASLKWDEFPFPVKVHAQEQAGATAARNRGACEGSGSVLTFMDDDVVAMPGMLERLVQAVSGTSSLVAMATLIPAAEKPGPFALLYGSGAVFPRDVDHTGQASRNGGQPPDGVLGEGLEGDFVHFCRCKTGVLTIRAQDFHALGMFQDPTGLWPNWDDVDFGYRAYQGGFRLWRSYQATAMHYDHALESLEASCLRHERASRAAVHFFKRYPELTPYFSAYERKRPISLSADPPRLLAYKALGSLLYSSPSLAVMKRLASRLEGTRAASELLIWLYRGILGAHIHKGYRQGYREQAE